MDKLRAESEIFGAALQVHAENTVAAVPLDEWLAPLPGRRTLVIFGQEEPTRGTFDQIIGQIDRLDSLAPVEAPGEKNCGLSGQHSAVFKPGDLAALPFEQEQFDLVICAFVSAVSDIGEETLCEIGRILNDDGRLLIIDYLVPGSRLRGKKARRIQAAGQYINTWMRFRNPLHKSCLGQDEWERRLTNGQWRVQQMATRETPLDFDAWANCYPSTAKNRLRLRAMLVQAPEKAHSFLTPLGSGDRIAFRMTELFILATKNAV